jgi:hypothetical protein
MMSTCVQCRAVSPCQTLAMRVHSSGYVREGAEEACSFGCGREPELVFVNGLTVRILSAGCLIPEVLWRWWSRG